MDTTVPYHNGFLLGRSVDMRSLKPGFFKSVDNFDPKTHEANVITNKFAFATSLREVCDILAITPEYALKVKANIIENDTVFACLKTIGALDSFTIIFRQTFLHKKEYVPDDVISQLAKSNPISPEKGVSSSFQSPESLIADAVRDVSIRDQSSLEDTVMVDSLGGQTSLNFSGAEVDSESLKVGSTSKVNTSNAQTDIVGVARNVSEIDTHFVTAQEIGNEQIIILRIKSTNEENLLTFKGKLAKSLGGSSYGQLDDAKIEKLLEDSPKLDKKWSKKDYQDVDVDIEYWLFDDMEQYPATFLGMVKSIEDFRDKCVGWKDRCNHEGVEMKVHQRFMTRHVGDFKGKSRLEAIKDGFAGLKNKFHSAVPEVQPEETSDVDGNYDSFTVLDCESSPSYPLRVTLRSYEDSDPETEDKSFTSLALSEKPESTYGFFNKLFNSICQCNEAVCRILEFISSKRFLIENRTDEANRVLKVVQSKHIVVQEAIKNLNFINIPEDDTFSEITTADPLETVESYIEMVSSKLPPGPPLDILMIGKTGHGKSATGNSLLGMEKFVSAADSESVTAETTLGWADVDGRVLKVVDTPGVCDTNVSSDEGSINLAINSISDAISHCSQGFNALLLIIKFGTRMTDEERKAIGLLKCVLGQDVIKSHCVCVITYGDNFKTEMKGKKTFEEWCKSQGGFLKSIFEECSYRCVLFNNKSEDPKERKTQLIQLINKIDSFQDGGTRYTNSIFEFALRERERIVTEQKAPQVNEETVRDIQLILDYLNNMVANTGEKEKYAEELSSLKSRVDNLKNRVGEAENEQLGTLVETVFALAGAVHVKMDELADQAASAPEEQHSDSTNCKSGFFDVDSGGSDTEQEKREPSPPGPHSPGSNYGATSLDDCRRNLQDYYNKEVSPQTTTVNTQVAERVSEQIRSEKNCFPGDALVYFPDGEMVPLSEVKVGDKVMLRDTEGNLRFDEVYMFGHQDSLAVAEFVVLITETTSVSVSKEHSVYCMRNGKEVYVSVADVQIKDSLLVLNSASDGLVPAEVKSIKFARKQGVFAPFTLCGNVVVDDTLMSCYVNTPSPATAHAMLWPTRKLYWLSPRLLAWVNQTSKGDAIPWWARAALKYL